MQRILILIIILISLPASVWMQSGEANKLSPPLPNAPAFQRFNNENGLAQDTIFSILQDSKGFLWVGTWHGLSRFDGYQFVNYTHDFQNRHSISDNKVNSIIETKSGEIWVGTRNGLNRYNYATNDFDSYKFVPENPNSIGDSWVQTVYEDREGTIWVGTSKIGLSKFDKTTGTFTNYKNEPENSESLSDNNVTGIGEDREGNFWIATLNGLNKLDRQSGRFTRFQTEPQNPNSLSDNQLTAIFIDQEGLIWLGTEAGLNKFDPRSNQFLHYKTDKNNPYSLDSNSIRSIYEAKSGTLWVGTQSGLNRYFKETNSFVSYKYNPANPRSLGEGEVLSIFEDNLEQLWVGTSVGGLNKYNQKSARFKQFIHDPNNPDSVGSDNIRTIYEDRNKKVWIAVRKGVYIAPFGLFKFIPQQNKFKPINGGDGEVSAIQEDLTGRIWVGTTKGLYYVDPEMNRLILYRNDLSQFIFIMSIQEDRDGYFWIGNSNGEVSKFDPATGRITNLQYNLKKVNSLTHYNILALFEDHLGQIWIGSRNSLYKFNPATQNITQYEHEPDNDKSLSASDVGAIYEDKSGAMWFGTSSGGLNRFDPETETFTHFTEREGLPINNVYEILEDERGNLWLSTDKGLARFNIETKRFRTFDVNDGLTYNEFNDKSAFKNQNGEMYFGGPNGFVKFNPKDFIDSQFKPPVYLTEIRLLEQPFKTEQNLTELKELDLSWRDYVVSFDFAALDFTDPKKLQYQWKLEGFDTDWISGGTRHTATYTNLPGGEYILKVRATNVDGVWTEESLNLKIIVTPPFYRTLWFSLLISMAVAVLIWLIYRGRINQLRRISEAQTRFTQQLITSQEAERKRIASELHDGLGQNLVVIKNRALLGLNKVDDKERVAKELNSISESATQALEEVREITNNLRPQLLDRLGLTKAINAMLKKVSGMIEIESEIDPIDNIFSETEEISVYRIIQESLNNVIKHSNASSAIVIIKRGDNNVSITIEDNGQGFDIGNIKSKAGGLGLTGLRERAQLLNGEFIIDSKVGEGTKTRVVLNTEKRYE